MGTIGAQTSAAYGGITTVTWGGDTMALMKSLRFRGSYDEIKETVIGSNTKLLAWGAYEGEIELEAIYSTDDTFYADMVLSSGVMTSQACTIAHKDASATTKTMTLTVYPRSVEVVDNEDAFVRLRLTGTVLSRPSNPS